MEFADIVNPVGIVKRIYAKLPLKDANSEKGPFIVNVT